MISIKKIVAEILTENPDGVHTGAKQMVKWKSADAFTFIYSSEYNVYFESRTRDATHVGMMRMLASLAEDYKRDDYMNGHLDGPDGTISLLGRPIKIVGDKKNVLKYVDRIAVDYKNDDEKVDVRANVRENGYLGRVWKKKNVISFWAFGWWLHTIIEDGTLEKIIDLTGVDRERLLIDMGDSKRAIPYSEALKGKKAKELSPEKAKELMAKQHLDPDAKKNLNGSEFADTHYKKLAHGGDIAARMNAARMQSDGIIKLKDLI